MLKLKAKINTKQKLQFFASPASCGFPSPADDFVENELDLNGYLINHPASTFFVRAKGKSMIDASILDGDILVIDRSLTPKNNSIVLACVEGEFLIKRFVKKFDKVFLVPCNSEFQPIDVTGNENFSVEGVVTHVIHKLH